MRNNKRPEGNIRKRSQDSFQIRYSLGYDPLTGKRKRIAVEFKGDYEAAKKELRRLLVTVDNNLHVEPSKTTVGEFLTQWLDTIGSRVSPKTHERYSEFVNYFLIPELGASRLNKLDTSSIQKAYNKWEKTGRRDKQEGGLAPRTRLHIHRVLKLALKHATRTRLITYNPADDVIPPRPRKSPVNTLTVEQSAALLDALRKKSIYWPVLLAMTAGMRRGEVLALRWKNVDFKNKTVRVVESLEQTKKGIRFKAPKTEKTRAISMYDFVVNELKEWKIKQAKELAELKIEQTQETLVCSRYDGEPIQPRSITHMFEREMEKLPKLPKIRFHDLRHSHATQLLASGIHPKIAQERLGHSTITTTLDLYSHVTDTMQNDAASKLNTVFRSALRAKPTRGPKGPQLG